MLVYAAEGRKLDVIVANAGRADATPLDRIDADLFDKIFDLNVRGAFFSWDGWRLLQLCKNIRGLFDANRINPVHS